MSGEKKHVIFRFSWSLPVPDHGFVVVRAFVCADCTGLVEDGFGRRDRVVGERKRKIIFILNRSSVMFFISSDGAL